MAFECKLIAKHLVMQPPIYICFIDTDTQCRFKHEDWKKRNHELRWVLRSIAIELTFYTDIMNHKVTDINKEPGAGGANILDLLLIADTNTPFSSLSLSTIHVLLLVSDDCGCGRIVKHWYLCPYKLVVDRRNFESCSHQGTPYKYHHNTISKKI